MAQTITIDLTPDGRRIFQRPFLYFSQGDTGQEFVINLKSRFGLEIPAGATVKIEATKPSGFGFSETGVLSDGTATFTTAAIMTDEAGHFPVELSITASGKVLGTANFNFMIEPDPHPEGTTDGQAEEVIPELTQLVERVEDAASSVLDRQTVTNTLPAGSQASYNFDEETNTQTFGIPQGEAGAGAVDVTASAYSSSKTYVVGDYVIHNDYLYRCTTAITTAEAWTSGHWTQVLLGNDVSDVKSDIDEVYITGPNLFNPANATQGAWINNETGEVQSDTDEFWVSDYMDNDYSYIGTYGSIRIWLFDANKAYSGTVAGNANGLVVNAMSAKYVRVGFKTSALNSVTVVKGESIPAVTPYIIPHINNELLVDTNEEIEKINNVINEYVDPGLVDAYNGTITRIPSRAIGSAVVGEPISLTNNQYRSVGYFDITVQGMGDVVVNNVYVDRSGDIGYALVDADDVVVYSSTLEREFSSISISCADYPTATRLYFVYQTTSNEANGYYKVQSRVGVLEESVSMSDKQLIKLIFTPSTGVEHAKTGNCPFTKSTGSKFTGSGNGTITFTIPETNARVVSFGIRIPYSTQNVASVAINGRTVDVASIDLSTESGRSYKIQGDTYQRINIAAVNGKVSESVTIAVTSEDAWEIWLSDCAITNDDYALMPILYIYDGGRWHGTVTYAGEEMTIWSLHRKLGIPYAVATYPGAWDDPTSDEYPVSEVLEDIASGFAEIVLRTGHMGDYYKQSDKVLTTKFSDGFSEVEADNRGAVFAVQLFDKKVLRCMKQANADFMRGYPLSNEDGFFSPMYGDTDMMFIPPCSVYKSIPSEPMNFPIIKWAHGIGTVPQDDTAYANFYEDPNGTWTVASMNTLLTLEANNKALALRPSEFIAFFRKQ